jgi:uncharacterized membrane protein YgcG
MRRPISFIALASSALALGGCWHSTYEYPSAQYLHRTDTITMSAGNAQEINSTTQVINPWPKSAGNRHIPGNGDRMVNAVTKYRAKQSGSGGDQGAPAGQSGQGSQQGAGQQSGGGSAGTSPSTSTGGTLPY